MSYAISYIATGLTFLAMDAIWLTLMSGRFYKPQLGDMMADKVNFKPAILFYLLYVLGIVVFAVLPALTSGLWTTSLALGALFGLIAYSTYDLTNHATLRNWPAAVSVVDIAWGTCLTAVSATAGLLITQAVTGG